MSDTPTITIDMGLRCSQCGAAGAMTENGICMKCANKRMTDNLRRKRMDGTYKLEALSVALHELESLWNRKHDASDSFKVACESVASQTGLDKSVVAAYVNARMSDKLKEGQKKADQLALVFSEVA